MQRNQLQLNLKFDSSCLIVNFSAKNVQLRYCPGQVGEADQTVHVRQCRVSAVQGGSVLSRNVLYYSRVGSLRGRSSINHSTSYLIHKLYF